MDFEKIDYIAASSESAYLPLAKPQGPLQLNITVTPGSTSSLLLVFGIEFMQALQGVMEDRAYNAMAAVRVDDISG